MSTIKLAAVCDIHFDSTSRWSETIRVTNWIAEDLAKRGVDATLIGGDVYERRPTPGEVKAVAEWTVALAETAPVIGVYGNHDVPDSLAPENMLASRYPITFYDRPQFQEFAGAPGFGLACLPWPKRGQLLAQLGDVARETANDVALRALQGIFREFGRRARELRERGWPTVFLGHVQVRACRVSTGQPLVGMGDSFEVGIEDLALADADFYAFGHIHLGVGNEWDISGAPAAYAGSPRRTAYGELEEKSYLLIEFDQDSGRLLCWDRVPIPCAPMLLLEYEWRDGMFVRDDGEFIEQLHEQHYNAAGAEIRFRYVVDSSQRDAARAAAAEVKATLIDAGALHVKLEERVIATNRARLPEVAKLRTLEEKVECLWKHRGFDPGERRESLISKLASLDLPEGK